MKISIIGAGNIAWHLAKALEQADMDVIEIYARDRRKAKLITSELYQSDATNSLNFKDSEAEIFIVAVSDNAIEEVASHIELPVKSLLLHVSGSKSLATLEIAKKLNPACKIGVLYPLMTFTTGKRISFRTVPFCIEGEDAETSKVLFKISASISNDIYEVDSNDRLTLHLAAVFACNFTNHLFALSKEILNAEDLNFDLLKPIIHETLEKGLSAKHPAEVQTGPAVRRDSHSIETHRTLIKEDEDLLKVYDTLTASIQDWHLGK